MAARPVAPLDRAASAYIEGYMRVAGLGLSSTAERAGIPFNTFRYYVRGQRTMSVADFLTILDAIGLDPVETIPKIREIAVEYELP